MSFIKAHWLLCLCLFAFCALPRPVLAQSAADPKATKRTQALFQNLRTVATDHILFGHQDDLAYGVFWKSEARRSDVQESCGFYPALFGWDLGQQFGQNRIYNIDSVNYAEMRRMIQFAYQLGSVNTISWHLDNLASGGNAWDTTTAVRHLLPGGKDHDKLVVQLDQLAEFFKSLRAGSMFKQRIPIIFRPWHEHTGGWFWWGAKSCTPEEYKHLWHFTVDYLRSKGVHNVLYAYSPDFFQDEAEYMRNYPGDDYVDVFGLDYYYRPGNVETIVTDLPQKLAIMTRLAEEHHKIAAFTETGFEAIPDENWWTKKFLAQIRDANLAYVMLWRNANQGSKANHYYVPYPGHISCQDFIQFSRDKRVLFQDRLPKLYKRPKGTVVKPNPAPQTPVETVKTK